MDYSDIFAGPPVRGDWKEGVITVTNLPKDRALMLKLVRAINEAFEPFKEQVSVPMERVSGH